MHVARPNALSQLMPRQEQVLTGLFGNAYRAYVEDTWHWI